MNRLDLLLIQPPVHILQTELGANQVSPNIGLAYIAAYQRRQGRQVGVIDAHALRLGIDEILDQIASNRPRLIGLSAMTYQILQSVAVAEAVREKFPNIPLVIGGPHASSVPVRTMDEFPVFDALVVGEGEEAFGRIFADICNGGLREHPGIYIRGGNEEISRQPWEPLSLLDDLPLPAFDLFPLYAYWPFYSRRYLMELPLSASRGCPFQCTFCTKVMGDNVRYRSAESLLEETERNIVDYGLQQVIFTDENFTHNKHLVHNFCEGLIERGIARRVRFICQSRVKIQLETLQLMARAGFTHITYGVESGNQDILDKAAKGITLEQTRQAVRNAKNAGLIVDGNVILGLPYETEKTIRETINFTCSLPLDYASFFLLVPYPGSQVMAMARRGEGNLRLVSDKWEDFGKQTGGALELTTVSRALLERLQFIAYLRFYGHPKRWLPVFRKVSLATILTFLKMRLKAITYPQKSH